MRKQALFWAGQNGGASTEAFASLYDKMTDSEIKEQLIFVLSQRESRRQGAREAHGHREERQGQGAAQQGRVLARAVARSACGEVPGRPDREGDQVGGD